MKEELPIDEYLLFIVNQIIDGNGDAYDKATRIRDCLFSTHHNQIKGKLLKKWPEKLTAPVDIGNFENHKRAKIITAVTNYNQALSEAWQVVESTLNNKNFNRL